jgi:hypothetical protein
VLALQSVTLTMLMNPTRLRRIQDNELRVDPGEDTLTLPEVLNALRDTIWVETSELDHGGPYTNPDPMFSTLARHLQREHLNRLIDLARGMRWPNASGATIATLARQQLRDIRETVHRRARSLGVIVVDLPEARLDRRQGTPVLGVGIEVPGQ